MSKSLCCLLTVFVCLAATPAAAATDCPHEASREAVLDVGGADLLRIEAGAGSLRVEGQSGLAEVRVDGTACASNEDLLRDIQIKADRKGDTLVVVADMPDSSRWRNQHAHLDLVVAVPSSLALEVEDGSGSATYANVGALELQDDSGGITITQVGGSVSIDEDGSGGIEVSHVTGNLTVGRDGSGGIDFEDVGGRVRVP